MSSDGALFAIGDLHVEHPDNRRAVEEFRAESDADWLIVCGDVADTAEPLEWALSVLCERFSRVIWVPGNHELLTHRDDPLRLRGVERYEHLVALCNRLGVVTPEDPFPIWNGSRGRVRIAPLFLLYDYSFDDNQDGDGGRHGRIEEDEVVCVDEFLLHPDPYASRPAWCHARLRDAERRLGGLDPALPLVLVNHFPLLKELTRPLREQRFARWCGTTRTADWHRRFGAIVVLYGHLHIPRTTWHDGVRFEEVSFGYPRERRLRPGGGPRLRRILSAADA